MEKKTYDYESEMFDDVRQAIEDCFESELDEYLHGLLDRNEFMNLLMDELMEDDKVTGNYSGSYFCSRQEADEALSGNFDLLGDAMVEFGLDGRILQAGPEVCDVNVRCYLLPRVIANVLDWYDDNNDYED